MANSLQRRQKCGGWLRWPCWMEGIEQLWGTGGRYGWSVVRSRPEREFSFHKWRSKRAAWRVIHWPSIHFLWHLYKSCFLFVAHKAGLQIADQSFLKRKWKKKKEKRKQCIAHGWLCYRLLNLLPGVLDSSSGPSVVMGKSLKVTDF